MLCMIICVKEFNNHKYAHRYTTIVNVAAQPVLLLTNKITVHDANINMIGKQVNDLLLLITIEQKNDTTED